MNGTENDSENPKGDTGNVQSPQPDIAEPKLETLTSQQLWKKRLLLEIEQLKKNLKPENKDSFKSIFSDWISPILTIISGITTLVALTITYYSLKTNKEQSQRLYQINLTEKISNLSQYAYNDADPVNQRISIKKLSDYGNEAISTYMFLLQESHEHIIEEKIYPLILQSIRDIKNNNKVYDNEEKYKDFKRRILEGSKRLFQIGMDGTNFNSKKIILSMELLILVLNENTKECDQEAIDLGKEFYHRLLPDTATQNQLVVRDIINGILFKEICLKPHIDSIKLN